MKIAQPNINEITPESSVLIIFRGALKSTEQVDRSIQEFVGFMEATREANRGVYRAFGQLVSTN